MSHKYHAAGTSEVPLCHSVERGNALYTCSQFLQTYKLTCLFVPLHTSTYAFVAALASVCVYTISKHVKHVFKFAGELGSL